MERAGVRTVAERQAKRAATPAESRRVTGYLELVAVYVDQLEWAVDAVMSIMADQDRDQPLGV